MVTITQMIVDCKIREFWQLRLDYIFCVVK